MKKKQTNDHTHQTFQYVKFHSSLLASRSFSNFLTKAEQNRREQNKQNTTSNPHFFLPSSTFSRHPMNLLSINPITCSHPLRPNPLPSTIRASIKNSHPTNAHNLFDQIPSPNETNYLQSGGLGTAFLSATSTASVKISPFVATLAANPTFVSGLVAWAVAQWMKVFLNFFVERKWKLGILFESGGMPSSHSALCTALTTSVALCHGVADSLFPVALGFSLIVMYDATGVRRHAGMQAEVLNMIIADLFQGHPISERKLKELLGHTVSQVIAGALLGVLVACFICQVYLAAP